MAFFAPFIAAAIGVGAVGQALIGIGLSLGTSYLARKLKPKQSTSAAATGMQLSLSYDPNGPRQWPFGRVASAGTLVYHNTYGPNGNDYLQMLFKLGDVPCSALVGLYVDGEAVTIGANVASGDVNGNAITEYTNALWVKFHDGAWGQSADADLTAKATGAAWSSNNRGRGVCNLRMTAKYDPDLFKNGRPNLVAVFDAGLMYDWRKDSTNGGSGAHRFGTETTYEWSDNPAIVLYNYMRGIYVNGSKVGGMNAPPASLPVAIWTAAANACDEVVSKVGGTEKRYRASGIINLDSEHASVVTDLLATMAGELIDAGGVFKLYAGVAQTPVISMTDADLYSNEPVRYSPKLSRSGLVNAVFGSFTDPSALYQSTSLPPRISLTDRTEDGGTELSENYGLGYVTSGTQGQRVLEILRRRGRYQRVLSVTAQPAFAVLEAGDWITWTSDRYGFVDTPFEVSQALDDGQGNIALQLRETSDGIFAWTAALDELDPLDPQPVGSGGARFSAVTGIVLANVTVTGAGATQRPGLQITWDSITDPTVTALDLEYRKVGDTVALQLSIFEPAAGAHTWITGIQGGLQYEARLRPVTQPVRAVAWSSWIQPVSTSAPVVVDVAAIATAVPPDTITPAMLSAQARLELQIVTATEAVTNSVTARLNEAVRQAQEAASAAIGAAAQNTMLLRSVRATSGANTIAITETLAAVGGADELAARWAVAIDVNGNVTGLVQLSGDLDYTQFSVIADRFAYAHPSINGGNPVPILSITTVEGDTVAILSGELIANAIKAGQVDVVSLSAIVANLGIVTAGRLQNAANTSFWDLNTGDFQIG